MSAYFVFIREKTLDQSELAIYFEQVSGTMQGRGAKVLAADGNYEVVEGAPAEAMLILEFPNIAAAKGWYNSPAYREAREHRFKASQYRVILVEGVPPGRGEI